MKRYMVLGHVLLAFWGTYGMDSTWSLEPLVQLPSDLVQYIVEYAKDRSVTTHTMRNTHSVEGIDETDIIYIPYTLREVSYEQDVWSVAEVNEELATWTSSIKMPITLDHMCCVSKQNYSRFYLSGGTLREVGDGCQIGSTDSYLLDLSALEVPSWMTTDDPTQEECVTALQFFMGMVEQDGEAQQQDTQKKLDYVTFFDGINSKKSALIGITDIAKSYDAKSVLFLLEHSQKSECVKQKPFLQTDKGLLTSVLLHPESNRTLFSVSHGVLDHVVCMGDIHADGSYHETAQLKLPMGIKKGVYLGKNTYLALTDQGMLATLWLDEESKLNRVLHTNKSHIIDIAVDNSYATEKGFKPHIAYINKVGEIFVTSLMVFAKPTMMLAKKVENPDAVWRLFYDKGRLAVLYRAQDENEFSDFTIYPDNLGLLYLKTVLAQQARMQKN